MRILIVGAGGAGGYFAARWAEAGLDVTLLARGAHLAAIQAQGLRIRQGDTEQVIPVRAIADARDAGDVDLVVFATKTWQLADAVASVAPHVPPTAMVLGLQNGVEIVDELSRAFPPAAVLGSTCRIISFIEEPGVIRHLGIPPTILLGEPGGGRSERTDALQAALDLGPALSVQASSNIQREIWRKFLFFAPISAVGSVTRVSIGAFRVVPESRAMLRAAMQEVLALATAHGIALAQDSDVQTLAVVDGLPPDGTSSMQRDIADGRPSELDALAGAVSRMARAASVPTPVHDALYASLLPQELAARRAYGIA
jgi:2-dehydropantoate 2-reductase